jgi:serine/threonine protein kinase
VVDFNVAKKVEGPEDTPLKMSTHTAGTLSFAAPERLSTDPENSYTEKVDIWSAGIVLVMLLTGQHPFADVIESSSALMALIQNSQEHLIEFINKADISSEAKDLAKSMLRMDPQERPSTQEVLLHTWFNKQFTKDLGSAINCLQQRSCLKDLNHDEFFMRHEGVSMANLAKELLCQGLDRSSSQLKKTNSVMVRDDFADQFTTVIKEEHDVEQLNRQIARMDPHKEITIYDNHQKLLDRSQFTKHF